VVCVWSRLECTTYAHAGVCSDLPGFLTGAEREATLTAQAVQTKRSDQLMREEARWSAKYRRLHSSSSATTGSTTGSTTDTTTDTTTGTGSGGSGGSGSTSSGGSGGSSVRSGSGGSGGSGSTSSGGSGGSSVSSGSGGSGGKDPGSGGNGTGGSSGSRSKGMDTDGTGVGTGREYGPVQGAVGTTARGSLSADSVSSDWRDPCLIPVEEIARLADPASGVAAPPTVERLAAMSRRAHELYNRDDLKVCAVCDQQRFTTDPLHWKGTRHISLMIDQLPHAQYHLAATDAMDLHPDLRAQYDVSDLVPPGMKRHVSGLLLSPRGMGTNGRATVCRVCMGCLASDVKPKFSIANG
jgi:hypothetical protein